MAGRAVAGLLEFASAESPPEFDRLLDSFPIVDEIDPATQPPVHEFPAGASRVATILGRSARVLDADLTPKVMAWVIGRGKGLKPGAAYVIEVEYPDDVPRSLFVANRGADLVRGFATGTSVGDSRQQYVQPSIESLAYPQTGRWQTYRTIFFLHDRFQGLYAQRDSRPGGRPFGPADGFHVIIDDDHDRSKGTSTLPFDGQVGYVAVDSDRAGPHVRLLDAGRSPAQIPRSRLPLRLELLHWVSGYVRRFNQAFLAVPRFAGRSWRAIERPRGGGAGNQDPAPGNLYLVVNTSMRSKQGVTVHLSARGTVRDLVEHRDLMGSPLRLEWILPSFEAIACCRGPER